MWAIENNEVLFFPSVLSPSTSLQSTPPHPTFHPSTHTPYQGVFSFKGSWCYWFNIRGTEFSLFLCLIQPWRFSDSPSSLPVITKSMPFASWWIEIWSTKCGHVIELKEIIIQKEIIWGRIVCPCCSNYKHELYIIEYFNCFPINFSMKNSSVN